MINDVSASKLPPLARQTKVITGFNTDIEYQGVTYHVQTEDKGMKTPLILSLVYNRGTILASKRSPYDDLLGGEFDENQLAERLHKQHKLICAAVRAGRIEDLKRMTTKAAAEKRSRSKAEKENNTDDKPDAPIVENKKLVADAVPSVEIPQTEISTEKEIAGQPFAAKENDVSVLPGLPAPVVKENISENISAEDSTENIREVPLSVLEDVVIYDDVQIVEDEIIPVEAVEIVASEDEAVGSTLKIEMLDNIIFKSGERKALALIVKRGDSEIGLEGAHVMVKVIGSSFRPLIFHSKTEGNGTAVVQLQLPHFRTGRAAIIVKAMHGGEETELRRVIQSR